MPTGEWVNLEETMPKDPRLQRAYEVVYKLLSLHTLLRIREGTVRREKILRRFYDHLNLVVELVAEGLEKREVGDEKPVGTNA